MKTNFATAAMAAAYLAYSAQGQNYLRFLDDTCPSETEATFKRFNCTRDEPGYPKNETFYLKGRDGKALCTNGDKIEMGLNNRAWVNERPGYDTFKPNYLSSTLKFDVNMSDVGCNCAAGVFLVNLNEESCKQGEYDGFSPRHPSLPQCSTVDVMKANDSGFQIASKHCKDGACTAICKSEPLAPGFYGPSGRYIINTQEPYQVHTTFYTGEDGNLSSIKTELIQKSNMISLSLTDCDFDALSDQLNMDMAMAISTYSLDAKNNPLTDTCTQACNSASSSISGIEWTLSPQYDDDEESGSDEDESSDRFTWGKAAPSLTSGQCADVKCSECREFWSDYGSTGTSTIGYRCKDDSVYSYSRPCNKKKLDNESKNFCMTGAEEYCHWSWPSEDPLLWKSEQAACRSVPQDYIKGDWKYGNKDKGYGNGLCPYGCEEKGGKCYESWPLGEPRENSDGIRNPKFMRRCKLPH